MSMSSGVDYLTEVGFQLTTVGIPLLLAVTLHEVAHGAVADRFGDHTARMLGRLTLNPFPHIDPFGTVLLPLLLYLSHSGFMFGYAKPVPIDPRHFQNPRRDMAIVALAGPVSNLLQALVYMSLLHLFATTLISLGLDGSNPFMVSITRLLATLFKMGIIVNSVLFVFNLIPIPPLDGGRVATGFLPVEAARMLGRIEPYGIWILFGLVLLDPYLGIMSRFIWPVVDMVSRTLLGWAVGPLET